MKKLTVSNIFKEMKMGKKCESATAAEYLMLSCMAAKLRHYLYLFI
jgi:hypothetical protein